jgi:hypothetical protein
VKNMRQKDIAGPIFFIPAPLRRWTLYFSLPWVIIAP